MVAVKLGTISALCGMLLLAACGSAEPVRAPLADDSDAAVTKAIDSITTFPTELDPRIWDGMAIKPDIRDAIQQVVDRNVRESGIEGLTVDGVDLFGSNASYEYDDKSDVSVHVFTHKPGLTAEELSPFMKLLTKELDSRQEGRILLNGAPLEVVFHSDRSDNYGAAPGIGQYSVTEGRWLEMPIQQPDNFDRDQMKIDVKRFIGEYNNLVREYESDKKGFDCSRFDALNDELGDYRSEGFDQNLGSRSTQNLTYRALRRLNVSVTAMIGTLDDECNFINESVG